MSQSVKTLFDSISPTYDRLNHILSLNVDKGWRKKTISRITKQPLEIFQALDLCAGTHDMGLECLRQFPNVKITAMDFSEEMLKAGEHKISLYLKNGQITPIVGDALKMPFPDNHFDVIFCAYGVRNFSDTIQGLKEIRRVLNPNGQLLILDFFRPENFFSRLFHKSYATHILPRVGQWISGNKAAYTYLRDSIQGFLTTAEMGTALLKLNFDNVAVTHFFAGISSCVSATRKTL